MKKILALLSAALLALSVFAGCTPQPVETPPAEQPPAAATPATQMTATASDAEFEGTFILLSDAGITVNGEAASTDDEQAVYLANDIVYYEEGHDFTYGEGTEADAHSKEEAAAHTVVHITEPGQYVLSGKLSRGQIAVDLGDGAKKKENAVVTLVLNGIDITCEVAPAVIFYNVYECGDKDEETAVKDVDTRSAGANVLIADNSVNNVTGAYVARIYDPDTVELNAAGTEVEDADKLHKYDAAFYSRRSMNIGGGELGNGILNINAKNEGLDSELHLTVNGGNINIVSGNDGINTNEDNVSVTTINGGSVNILVNGATGEGDGIDSNGWLVINGGTVITQACAFSGDAGIDSDMGIHINGGTVVATGNMLDHISESAQNYAVFQFAEKQNGGVYTLKNAAGEIVAEHTIENDFSYLIISSESLSAGEYTLWQGEVQLKGISTENGGRGGMGRPGGMQPFGDVMPGQATPPEGMEKPQAITPPEGAEPLEGMERPEMPEGAEPPEKPDGGMHPDKDQFQQSTAAEASDVFPIVEGGNYFQVIAG